MYTEKNLKEIKDLIIKNIPGTEEIILFGSYARGTASDSSDLDIMVLIDKEYEWRERKDILNRIYQDTGDKGYIIDFILKTKKIITMIKLFRHSVEL